MKKLSLLLTAFLGSMVLFSSCSDDADSGGTCTLPEPTCKRTSLRDTTSGASSMYFYNGGRLVEIVSNYNNTSSTYKLEYNQNNDLTLVSQGPTGSLNKYRELEYNSAGQLITLNSFYSGGSEPDYKEEYEYGGGNDITLTVRSNRNTGTMKKDMAIRHYYSGGKRVLDSLYWQGDLTKPAYNYKKYTYAGNNIVKIEDFLSSDTGWIKNDLEEVTYDSKGRPIEWATYRRDRGPDTLKLESTGTSTYAEGQASNTHDFDYYIKKAYPASYAVDIWSGNYLVTEQINKDADGTVTYRTTRSYVFNDNGYPTSEHRVDAGNYGNNNEYHYKYDYCCSCE